MRTYGRVYANDGSYEWVVVETAPDGDNSMVWLTTLIQEFKLNLNEAPFNADHGIPAQQSVLTQVFPDFYVFLIQSRYAQHFASLIITKLQRSTPTYNVALTTLQGVQISTDIAV